MTARGSSHDHANGIPHVGPAARHAAPGIPHAGPTTRHAAPGIPHAGPAIRHAGSVAETAAHLAVLTLLCLTGSGAAHAGTWTDLWSTHEQQAQKLLDSRQPEAAASLFSDARRRAYAEMEAGQYAKAAKSLAPFNDANSQYNRGNALAHAGELREALTAYDAALAATPGDKDVIHNRDLVKQALEQQQNQSGQQGGANGRPGSQGSKGGQSQGGNHSQGGGQPQPGQQTGNQGGQQQGNQSQSGQSQAGNQSQGGGPSQSNNQSQAANQPQGGSQSQSGQSQAGNQSQGNGQSQSANPSQAANQSNGGQSQAPNQPQGANPPQPGQSQGQSQAANQNGRQPQAGAQSQSGSQSQGNPPQGTSPSQAANSSTAPQSQANAAQRADNTGGEGALAPNGQPSNGSDANANLNAQNAQQDADAAIRYRQSQQGRPPPGTPQADVVGPDGKTHNSSEVPPPKPPSEQALALDQWLRGIPDDSAELLRRKFLIEHMLKQQRNEP